VYSEESPKQEKLQVHSNQSAAPHVSKTSSGQSVKKENATVKTSFKDLLQQQAMVEKPHVQESSSLPKNSEKPTEVQQNQETEQSQPITSEDIFRVWPDCIQAFTNEPHLFSILSELIPAFENNEINLQLISHTQASIFTQEIESRLYELLWFHLKSKDFRFRIQVTELTEEETKKKPITPEERYAHLLQINQKIQKLRDAFDLEIE